MYHKNVVLLNKNSDSRSSSVAPSEKHDLVTDGKHAIR